MFFFQYKEPLKSQMLPMKCFTFLFLMQTSSKNLTPVRKPVSIYGMDSVNGKITSGCHILKVGNNLSKCNLNSFSGDPARVHQAKPARSW